MNATSGISSSMSGASFLERSKQLFQQFDTSGDGSIDFEEFKAAGPKDGKQKTGGPDPAEMFAKIDTNGDGKIDESEHTAFMKQMQSSLQSYSGDAKSTGTSSSVFSLLM